jgi:hypothetical protein
MTTDNPRIWRRFLLAAAVFCLLPAAPLCAQIDKWGYWQNGVTEAWWFSTAEFKTEEAEEAVARWHRIGAGPKRISSGTAITIRSFLNAIRRSPLAGELRPRQNKLIVSSQFHAFPQTFSDRP